MPMHTSTDIILIAVTTLLFVLSLSATIAYVPSMLTVTLIAAINITAFAALNPRVVGDLLSRTEN